MQDGQCGDENMSELLSSQSLTFECNILARHSEYLDNID